MIQFGIINWHIGPIINLLLFYHHWYIDGFVQDCIISSALAMEIVQSCTKPLIYVAFSNNIGFWG